jgi:hypothetical protein
MLRIVSAAVAATLFGFTGLPSAQTAEYPYSADKPITAPANRGYEQNYRYDRNYRGTPNSALGRGADRQFHSLEHHARSGIRPGAEQQSIRERGGGEVELPRRYRGVGQHQIPRLPFRRVAFLRQHEARGLHVPRRCRS